VTDTLLGDLRGRFRETSRIRLDEMASLLAALERDREDAASLQKLAKHFHGLAGMGGTYGFPRVSHLGDEAEATIMPFVKRGAVPDAASVARWKEVAAEIAAELWSNGLEPAVPQATAVRTHRILVVEDDATTMVFLRGMLAAAGYEVAICSDPALFERTLLAFEPHLVLMDVQLSDDVSGPDLVRLLRRTERFAALPVILMTSDTESREVDAGTDPLVTKPIDGTVLLGEIARRLA
jgi:CheY-like chemotaxis protein